MDRDTTTTSAPPATPDEARDEALPTRPRTRAECEGGPRPCPWVSCAHHLLSARLSRSNCGVGSEQSGRSMTDDDCIAWLEASPHTCELDVADLGGTTLEEVSVMLGLTRERIRQIEAKAQRKVRPLARARSLATYLEPDTDTRDPDSDAARPQSRRGHTTARPIEDTPRRLTPAPATWAGPTHPDQVGDAGDVFWCAPLGASMRVGLCCARQVATVEGPSRMHVRQHPRYPGCASCPEGNALRARLGVVPDVLPTREGVRHLPLVAPRVVDAPLPEPEPVAPEVDDTPAASVAVDPPTPAPIEEVPMRTDPSTENNDVTVSMKVDGLSVEITSDDDDTQADKHAPKCAVGPCPRPVVRCRSNTHKALRGCCRDCRRRGVDMMRRGSAKPGTIVAVLGETYWRTAAGASMARPPQPAPQPPPKVAPTVATVAPETSTAPTAIASTSVLTPSMLTELREGRRALALARRVGGVDALEAILSELAALGG